MKKIFSISICILSTIALLVSCNKNQTDVADTTYTLIYSVPISSYPNLQQNLFINEYSDSNEKLISQQEKDVKEGFSKTYTANSHSVKVKVMSRLIMKNDSSIQQSKWVQQVFYLEPGGNITIDMKGDTVLGATEP
jgi:ABC-type uncharacterized transport system auxiliary subunit